MRACRACRIALEVDKDITVRFCDKIAVCSEILLIAVASVGLATAVEYRGTALIVRNRNGFEVDSADLADALNDQIDILAVLCCIDDRVFGDLALAELEGGYRIAVVIKEILSGA